MEHVTSSTGRPTASLREELLGAASALLPEHGYAGLRMADVAARVGVSRQTVYNEFGTKAELVSAVSLHTASEFLEGVAARLAAADDLAAGIQAAARYTIEHARHNRIVAAALGTEVAEDLLPYLTTRGEPVLRAATDHALGELTRRVPELDAAAAELISETMVRLTLSHLMLRTHSAEEAAESVRSAIMPMVEHYSGGPPEEHRKE